MSPRRVRLLCTLGAVLSMALFARVSSDSLQWIGRKFPGFLIMQNRVVASVSLPDWGDNTAVYQNQVVALDGVEVQSAEQIYNILAGRKRGSSVEFGLRDPAGNRWTTVRKVLVFTPGDYALLFGAFLVNGCFFFLIGLGLVYLAPQNQAARSVLATGVCVGVFVTTAVDLYGPPYVFFRLHAAAEAIAAACFLHLAMMFPTDRLGEHRRSALVWIYAPFFVLAGIYQYAIHDPTAYTFVHLVASGGFGIFVTGIVLSILFDLFFAKSPLARRRIAVVALGSVTGLLPITLVWAVSGFGGGTVPLNAVALTAFFFPMSIAFAVLKRDLFEIDVVLRRALTYGAVMILIIGSYFLVLFTYELLVPGREFLARSPVTLALLNLVLLFIIAPVREAAQRFIDRIFFRQAYGIESALAKLSDRLATARALERVEEDTRAVLDETVSPTTTRILFQQDSGWFESSAGDRMEIHPQLLRDLAKGVRTTRYSSEDEDSDSNELAFWNDSGVEIILPLRSDSRDLRVLALGCKRSGGPYNSHDIAFLETAANQISLAVANAMAFDQLGDLNRHLEELNEGLEVQVASRTAELNGANEELNRSLGKLQITHRELEKNHASLLRADRLATLGRLTAGMAHEINTPLSAVLNALKVITDLAIEYDESIDDPTVERVDHKEIAEEIRSTAVSAREWGDRAAAYVRNVKQHGRELRGGTQEKFAIRAMVEKTEALVAHRLRAATCRLEVLETSKDVQVWGEPARLGQVLVNLVTNAIDAYEEKDIYEGVIGVRVGRGRDGEALVEVFDRAGGIPSDVLPHVFDELYTTKDPGRGTGLGLWISRNIMEEGFGGSLDVVSDGDGSRFVAKFSAAVSEETWDPRADGADAPALVSEAAA